MKFLILKLNSTEFSMSTYKKDTVYLEVILIKRYISIQLLAPGGCGLAR